MPIHSTASSSHRLAGFADGETCGSETNRDGSPPERSCAHGDGGLLDRISIDPGRCHLGALTKAGFVLVSSR